MRHVVALKSALMQWVVAMGCFWQAALTVDLPALLQRVEWSLL